MKTPFIGGVVGVLFSWLFLGINPATLLMLIVALALLFLGIFKEYEPLLLIPIGFGALLANIPGGGMSSYHYEVDLISKISHQSEKKSLTKDKVTYIYRSNENSLIWSNSENKELKCVALIELNKNNAIIEKCDPGAVLRCSGVYIENSMRLDEGDTLQIGEEIYTVAVSRGLLAWLYKTLLATGIIPPLIFMGVGAMTDFGPLMRNVGLAFYGAAAQIGIFIVFFLALFSGMFNLNEAASLGIIGGADGPTAVYLTTKLAPHLLGPIAVAAYSYMALVPVIIPWIVRRTTTAEERRINMREQDKKFGSSNIKISKKAKIAFPIVVVFLCGICVPSSTVLVGMLMFGNLIKEVGIPSVVERLCGVSKGALINIMTIFLGLCVGGTMEAEVFLNFKTVGIILGGLFAFSLSVAGGIYGAKLWNMYARDAGKKLTNPLIGATGLSAVPMASRVANEIALKEDPGNNIIHYCMASNIAGVIGSAVAAGFFLSKLG